MSKLESLFVDGELVLGARETHQVPRAVRALETPFLGEHAYASNQDPRAPRAEQGHTIAPTAGAQAAATSRNAPPRRAPGRVADEAGPWSQGEWDDEGDGAFGMDHDFESVRDFESVGELESESEFESEDESPEFDSELTRAQAQKALSEAIAAGERDETRLANIVFFRRHLELDPNLALDPKRPGDVKLAQEWQRVLRREVWAAIQTAAEDKALKVRGRHAAHGHREFWGAEGKRFRDLVAWAARETDLHAGLLAAAVISETGGRSTYLRTVQVDSYWLGVDDFYEMRHVLAQNVPAYAQVNWNRAQKPEVHLNDAQTQPREVKTIRFDSGRDGLLATAVCLKYGEVRLRSDAKALGGDFDALPLETRLALIRISMAAGRGGAKKRLRRALEGHDILRRNWEAPRKYHTERNATIRAAQALHFDRWVFNLPTSAMAPQQPHSQQTQPEAWAAAPETPQLELEGLASDSAEAFSDEELEHLGLLEHEPSRVASATIGFEFDLNYGFETEVVDAMGLGPPPGWSWPGEGLLATNHEHRDGAGTLADGFVVKMDAVRLEIDTEPVRIDNDAEFDTVVKNIVAFGRELRAAEKTPQRASPVPGLGGIPIVLHHPRTVVNQPERDASGALSFPGDRKHAVYQVAPVPLVIHRLHGRYPTSTALWAAPQATLTLPLAEFGKLVWEIHRTMGAAPGEALTGPASARLGVRDDLAWTALKIAVAERKRRIGTQVADGSTITAARYTRALTSLVAMLVMYLLTGARTDARDDAVEFFAKGSLPLNVKTPLWQIHKHALNGDERTLLHQLYTDAARRATLYALVPRRPAGNGATALFPTRTDIDTTRFFSHPPTWDTLVDALAEEKPIKVTKANRIEKKKHQPGDEILIAPLSSKIDWAKTEPRIAVELRRIGFAPVPFSQWVRLMQRLRALARMVNP